MNSDSSRSISASAGSVPGRRTAYRWRSVRTSNRGRNPCEPLTARTREPTGPGACSSVRGVASGRDSLTSNRSALASLAGSSDLMRLDLAVLRPQPQREASPMQAPVIGVEVGVVDLERGQGLDHQSLERRISLQPVPDCHEVVALELPLDLAVAVAGGFRG
ncbi:MAG: hypothetical protein U1F35_20950 [Steroidobacteraceae bacterium]